MLVSCIVCNKEFEKKLCHIKKSKRHFCSSICYQSIRRIDKKEYIGKTYNSYTIKSFDGRDEHSRSMVLAECKCGKITRQCLNNIKSGVSKRCHYCSNRKYQTVGKISSAFFIQVKKGAKRMGRDIFFDITMEDIWNQCVKQNHKCALSGVELTYKDGSKDSSGNASVDRIDSSKAYTTDNIQIIHKYLNRMKNTLSDEIFIKMCDLVSNHNNWKYQG